MIQVVGLPCQAPGPFLMTPVPLTSPTELLLAKPLLGCTRSLPRAALPLSALATAEHPQVLNGSPPPSVANLDTQATGERDLDALLRDTPETVVHTTPNSVPRVKRPQ